MKLNGLAATGRIHRIRVAAVGGIVALLLAVLGTSGVQAGVGTELFLRGDANSDTGVDIGDSVFILSNLFSGGPAPTCADAADTNDDGAIDIADSVYVLSFLFLPGSPAPAAPFPTPGVDPTADGMVCGPLCVEVDQFIGLVPALFPLSLCVPEVPFDQSGVTGAVCTATSGPTCSPLMIAGCDLTVNLDSFEYDGVAQAFTLVTSLVIDPLGIEATIPIFGLQTCTTSGTATVMGTLTLETVPVAPGVVEIVGLIAVTEVTSADVDFSPCGLLAPFGDILVDFFVDQVSALADQLVMESLEPQLLGVQLCE